MPGKQSTKQIDNVEFHWMEPAEGSPLITARVVATKKGGTLRGNLALFCNVDRPGVFVAEQWEWVISIDGTDKTQIGQLHATVRNREIIHRASSDAVKFLNDELDKAIKAAENVSQMWDDIEES